MTTIRTLEDGVTGLRCDTAGCHLTAPAPRHSTALDARNHYAALGWSTPAPTPSVRGNPHIADYCPDCTRKRAQRSTLCTHCPGGELFDLLGHTRVGHQAARALYQHDCTLTPDRVARMSRAELRAVPYVGAAVADAVLNAVLNTYGTTVPDKPADSTGEIFKTLQQTRRTVQRLMRHIPQQQPATDGPTEDDLKSLAEHLARDLHEAAFAVGRTLLPR